MEHVTVQGVEIPALGLGTWDLNGEVCVRAVHAGLEMGYRHIDTARMYGNEAEVGRGLRDSGVDRGEVFLTTKIWPDDLAAADVARCVEDSLRTLATDYVDLLLIHWPNPAVPVTETLGAFARARESGQIRHIGVSNFPVALMQEAVDTAGAPVLCNQMEYHPFLTQKRVLAYVRAHDIMLTAYCPLARGRVHESDRLTAIGHRFGKSPEQVALRWLIQQDRVSAIPRSSKESHLRGNIDIFDFRLDDEEMAAVGAEANATRLVKLSFSPDWDPE